MKISTKGRYGLRTLMDIAIHQSNGPVNLNDIAERQGISSKYLWQIVNLLKTAGTMTITDFTEASIARPDSEPSSTYSDSGVVPSLAACTA